MPNYKGHLAGGVVAYGLLLFGVSTITRPSLCTASEWLFFTLAGSLFPDIDIKSRGQKYFYRIVFFLLVFLIITRRLEALAYFSLFIVTPMLVRHRGIFHELWFIVVISFIGWICASITSPYLSQILFFDTLFFILGALSHIFLDRGFIRICHGLLESSRSRQKGRRG